MERPDVVVNVSITWCHLNYCTRVPKKIIVIREADIQDTESPEGEQRLTGQNG